MRTANEVYKTLANNIQLNSTNQTVVNEIIAIPIAALPYNLMNLKDLDKTDINSVVGKVILNLINRNTVFS